jgi:hypothetical protein
LAAFLVAPLEDRADLLFSPPVALGMAPSSCQLPPRGLFCTLCYRKLDTHILLRVAWVRLYRRSNDMFATFIRVALFLRRVHADTGVYSSGRGWMGEHVTRGWASLPPYPKRDSNSLRDGWTTWVHA